MRFCYMDESGVPEIGKGTSHFVLLGLSIVGETWTVKDKAVHEIKGKYDLWNAEIHAGWLLRRYVEQEKIANFEKMDWEERRRAVRKERENHLLRIGSIKGPESTKKYRRDYRKTDQYIHLTFPERLNFARELMVEINQWKDMVLFAECCDKSSFKGRPPTVPPLVEAFTQVVTRFHYYLNGSGEYGVLVHDNSETVAQRYTDLMRLFHARGTPWISGIPQIIETPLFVDSKLTSMVQIADLCVYSVRRYCENGETDLLNAIFGKFNNVNGRWVEIRHYTGSKTCDCNICRSH